MAKVHYAHPEQWGTADRAICGWSSTRLTVDVETVTCRLCLRELLRRRANEPPPEEPFVSSGPYAVPDAARELDARALAAIERSVQGFVEHAYAWRSERDALRALITFRADGQGITSTSHPGRFERAPRGDSDPMRAVGASVDRIHGVDAALARAYREPRRFTFTVCECCGKDDICEGFEPVVKTITLSVEQQRTLLLWSVERVVVEGIGGSSAAPRSTLKVLGRARRAWGVELTERQLNIVKREGLGAVRDHLRAIGELAPAEESARKGEAEEMAIGDYDLKGWGEIEGHAGISLSTCKRLAKRADDPLPIHKISGMSGVFAKAAEIDAWFERNARQLGGDAA